MLASVHLRLVELYQGTGAEAAVARTCELVGARVPTEAITRAADDRYLGRHYLFRKSWLPRLEHKLRSLYLHHFWRSDYEDEVHNHPWRRSYSLILTGGYIEHRYVGGRIVTRRFLPGMINVIDSSDFHRVELIGRDCWTLFLSGPKVAQWGFLDVATQTFLGWEAHMQKLAERLGQWPDRRTERSHGTYWRKARRAS
jgi:hypothetical protein